MRTLLTSNLVSHVMANLDLRGKNQETKRPDKENVFASHSEVEEYQHVLQKSLEEGRMPPFLLQSEHLIGKGDDDKADKVIAYAEGILNRLSIKNTGRPLPPVEIYLADQKGLTLGVITEAKTPILLLGLGFLDFIIKVGLAEDHVGVAFGHERFHLRRHQLWSNLDNGRPEEAIADIYGTLEAHAAGYNPKAGLDLFQAIDALEQKALRKKEKHWHQDHAWALSLLDVHPPTGTRIRNTDIAIATLQLKEKLKEDYTPIPEDISSLLNDIHYKNTCDTILNREGYAEASTERKLVLLTTFAAGTLLYDDQYLARLHLTTTLPYFREIRKAPHVGRFARKHFDEIMGDQVTAQYPHASSLESRRWIIHQLMNLITGQVIPQTFKKEDKIVEFNRGERKPSTSAVPALYRTIKKYSEKFIGAQTIGDAIKAAEYLDKACRVHRSIRRGILALNLEETSFDRPNRQDIKRALERNRPIRLPWERHARWISGFDQAGTVEPAKIELLRNTSLSLGARDPRLAEIEVQKHSWKNHRNDWAFEELTFDDQGFIIALQPNDDENKEHYRKRFDQKQTLAFYLDQENKLQRERDQNEKELVEQVDWQDMEKDFWDFVGRNRQHLEPTLTLVPGGHVFARAFCKKLAQLFETDPRKWQDTKWAFVTGYRPRLMPKVENQYYDEDRSFPNSLPDLISGFETLHFGYPHFGHHIEAERGALPPAHPSKKYLTSFPEYFYDGEKPKFKSEYRQVNGRHITWTRKLGPTPKDKQNTYAPLAIDADHPYFELVLGLQEDEIDVGRKRKLFAKFHYCNPNTRRLENYFRVNPARALGLPEGHDDAGFRRIDHALPFRTDNGPDFHFDTLPIELLTTLRHLKKSRRKQRFALSLIETRHVLCRFRFLHDISLARRCKDELATLVEGQVEQNRQIDFNPKRSLKVLIDDFVKDHGRGDTWSDPYSVFTTRPTLKQDYEDHIQRRIKDLTPKRRRNALTSLMRLELERPHFRKWAVESWIEAQALHLGTDNGSKSYQRKYKEAVKNAIHTMHSSQCVPAIMGLLDRIEAQRENSFWTRDILIEHYGQRFLEKDGAARAIDALTDRCSHDDKLRSTFLGFITEPESPAGNKLLLEVLKRRAADLRSIKTFCDPDERFSLSEDEQLKKVGLIHKNFWEVPFELRTIYLDRVLFPTRQAEPDEYKNSVNYVLDKVLPLEKKFSAEAREALLVYLDCCPPQLRRVTFSALLSAADKKNTEDLLRPGQILAFVLRRTGAAGGQITQAAHSLLNGMDLQDPDMQQFRDDLSSSKVDFDRPFRWQIFERMDDVLPASKVKSIHHVGELLGCGSTAFVVACTAKDGESTALKLMRKDVLPIANHQFDRYHNAFSTLAEKQSHYKPLPSIVGRATETIQVSTNGLIAEQQVRYAESIYNNVSIFVNGHCHKTTVAPVVSAGAEYLETALVTGQHIGELPGTTALERKQRQENAIALDTLEEYLTLSGNATDEDCHGGQQKLQGNTSGRFDVSAIPYNAAKREVSLPTTQQKRALGQLYGLVFNAALQGQSPVEATVNAITTREWGTAKPYLVGWQRARWARADFATHFGGNDQEKRQVQIAILKAVWKTGQIDPTIIKGMAETLSVRSGFKMAREILKPKITETFHRALQTMRLYSSIDAGEKSNRDKIQLEIKDISEGMRRSSAMIFMSSFLKTKMVPTHDL